MGLAVVVNVAWLLGNMILLQDIWVLLFFFLTNVIVVLWLDFKDNSNIITDSEVLAYVDRPSVSVYLLKHIHVKDNWNKCTWEVISFLVTFSWLKQSLFILFVFWLMLRRWGKLAVIKDFHRCIFMKNVCLYVNITWVVYTVWCMMVPYRPICIFWFQPL